MSEYRPVNFSAGSPSRFSMLFAIMVVGLILLQATDLIGQGNLLITPRRVVFDGSKRSVDLNLANSGEDSATYAISLVQIRMTELGGFETITEPDPGQRFADKFVRFFPRSVTLAPNEAQVVKIEVTRRSQLDEGEYRSHFYFRAVPKAKPLGEEEEVVEDGSISVKLTPVFGITIPVIIRMGESTTKVSLSDLKLNMGENNKPNLEMTFNRSGNMSIYGDLKVDHVSSSGVTTRVGIANGVAVYTPNSIRKFNLNLDTSKGIDFGSGKLKVYFSAPSDLDSARYAEAELDLR